MIRPQPPKHFQKLSLALAAAGCLVGPAPALAEKTACQADHAGLVNLKTLLPDLPLKMPYASSENVFQQAFYSSSQCYLQREVAEALVKVQHALAPKGLGLLIWDCYRPLDVQKAFWAVVPDERYVANPYKNGSMHNRGVAVDLTLMDLNTQQSLEMPTGFDDFSERAHLDFQDLPESVKQHRQWLIEHMQAAGFQPLSTEWWHFSYPMPQLKAPLNVSFEAFSQTCPEPDR